MVKEKLLDKVRYAIWVRHLSYRIEEAYLNSIKKFILFHNKRHPVEMREADVSQFLTYLAVNRRAASSTQNQAPLSTGVACHVTGSTEIWGMVFSMVLIKGKLYGAILFLYRDVLKEEPGWLDDVERAKRPASLPVVFTKQEAKRILLPLEGTKWLMGNLLYGSGLRLMECVRLRVKDLDFDYDQITVRDAKGQKDRVTMLPISLKGHLCRHLEKVKATHEEDLKAGWGRYPYPIRS